MDCGIRSLRRFMWSGQRWWGAANPRTKLAGDGLLDADLGNETSHIFLGDVIELAFVFFFQAFAQIFRGNEARFTVAEVAAGPGAEFDERRVCQANDQRVA